MKKGQQKLYQTLTAKEILKQLEILQNTLEFFDIKPLVLKAAIEYIFLHEQKEKNEKKQNNHIQIR